MGFEKKARLFVNSTIDPQAEGLVTLCCQSVLAILPT